MAAPNTGVNRVPWTGLQRRMPAAVNQVNQFTWAGDMQLTGPDPSLADVFNVLDYGANGNGATDDTLSVQAALDAAWDAGGGVVYFPGGNRQYKISKTLLVASRTTVWCDGFAVLLAAPSAEWSINPLVLPAETSNYAVMFRNRGMGNYPIPPATRDQGITFRNLVIDYAELGSGPAGTGTCIELFYADDSTLEGCTFYAGANATVNPGRIGNATKVLECTNTAYRYCAGYWFRNCVFDHWSSPDNVSLDHCYAGSFDGSQLLNFNPDTEPAYGGYQPNQAAIGLTITNCTFEGLGPTARPLQIERLSAASTNSYVSKVLIQGCTFINAYLAMRSDLRDTRVIGNQFSGYPASASNVIRVTPLYGAEATGLVILGNTIRDPGTASGQFGVIRCEADDAIVAANTILGTTYTDEPFYSGTKKPSQYGNWFEKSGLTGRMQQGIILTNPNNGATNFRSAWGWEDLNGEALRMYMAGNIHQFWGTDESGVPRQYWSMEADSDNADFSFLVGTSFNSHIRVSPNAGLTATGTNYAGALQLTKGLNTVTTVPAASGVRLPIVGAFISITGFEVAVWNAGTEVLAVYPASNAFINDGAIGAHDRVLPGWVKIWYATDATHWLVKAEFYYGTDLAGNTVSALESASSDVDLTLAPETQPPTYDVNHVLLYGQSLSLGAEGTPGLSTAARYGSLMLGTTLGAQNNTTPTDIWLINGSGFNPLQVNGAQAEAPIYSAMATYRALTYRSQDITANTDQVMLASGCGIGGTAISQLQQGAVPNCFNRLISCMDQANTYAASQSLTYGVTAMVWMQGESNSTTSQATYATALRDIYADFVIAAQAETGQPEPPAMFMYQTTARDTNFNTTNLGVQMAQLDIGLNDAGCFMVGPVYPYNSSNNLHLPANSYRWWGAQLGKVMHRVLTLGQNWKPLHITTATMRGQRVLLEYYVPVGPLVFQDSWLEPGWTPGTGTIGAANAPWDATDKGFTIINNAGTVQPIASVVLVAANQVLITLASAPSGAPYFVRYADGSAGHYGHGSLRDSDPALADDLYLDMLAGQAACERQWDASGKRYPLYNWAVSQYKAITVV